MYMRHYILDGKMAVLCDSLLEWAVWFQTANRTVQRTEIGGILVSTIFLGLDHSHGRGDPLLFETCIFFPEYPEVVDRYFTWMEAEQGHNHYVQQLQDQRTTRKTLTKFSSSASQSNQK